jgi:hypothetical protein
MKWSRTVSLLCSTLLACCRQSAPPPDDAPPPSNSTATIPTDTPETVLFTDVTERLAVDFVHHTGHTDRYLMPEIMGGGGAVFDYDGDGDLDIYLVDSGDHTPMDDQPATTPNRLFRQGPDGTFSDATEASGLGDLGYGMGCAIGDIDNDGDLDVYVTNWGPDALYRNEGNGTFKNITPEAGIENNVWSCSAAFLDYDRDGDLDLYVANYLNYDPTRECSDDAGRPVYCGPKAFDGVRDTLYRNDGGSSFTDITVEAGMAEPTLAGLGVVCADLDDDGLIDVYVANDGDPNLYWVNQGDGTFMEDAFIMGVACNGHGMPEAGMGVTTGDVDADGDLDIFVTHLASESNTYYRNQGDMGFDDATSAVRLAAASTAFTGFGTAFFDYDNDGHLDLAVANGTVTRRQRPLADEPPFWKDYVEFNLLFHNDGTGVYAHKSQEAGTFASDLDISRGLIPADLDHDGDLDLLVINIEGPARIYRNNQTPEAGDWIDLNVVLPGRHRQALGAKVSIETNHRTLIRHVLPPGGYLTGGEAGVHLGLEDGEIIKRINVRWPDGRLEQFTAPPARPSITLEQGQGASATDA